MTSSRRDGSTTCWYKLIWAGSWVRVCIDTRPPNLEAPPGEGEFRMAYFPRKSGLLKRYSRTRGGGGNYNPILGTIPIPSGNYPIPWELPHLPGNYLPHPSSGNYPHPVVGTPHPLDSFLSSCAFCTEKQTRDYVTLWTFTPGPVYGLIALRALPPPSSFTSTSPYHIPRGRRQRRSSTVPSISLRLVTG